MRKLSELLELVLNFQDKNIHGGICSCLRRMAYENKISLTEEHIAWVYVREVVIAKGKMMYLFPAGEWDTREQWLKEQIAELKSKNL